ncbi:MAG: T9SS type A sorting domain-containing protein, partial [Bacteroidia bacterium]|nr:T9SS type A sorting domain-containing protein [Bacteroidia bacterium]
PSPNPNSRYYLDVIWTNSCEATRTTINTTRSNIKGKSVMIGIDEAELNNLIHLFPNPANNQITIKLPALEKETYIMITNQIGQTVISSQTSNQSEVIAIEQLAKGIYTVTIKTEHGTIHRKLIKQ